MSPDLRAALTEHMTEARITEFYGASETSFISLAGAGAPVASVGMPYPGVQIGIGPCLSQSPFETGEIWIKSPYLFDGYAYGKSAETKWHDNALTVGELGYFDGGGHLFLVGRKSRVITVADQNVSLDAIEATLAKLPGISTCAVVARPDRMRGQVPVCIIQSLEPELTQEEVARHCRAESGPHAIPRDVHFVSDMPVLSSGKPNLIELARRFGSAK